MSLPLPPQYSTFSSPSPTPGSGSPLVIYQSHTMTALQYSYHPTNCWLLVGRMIRRNVRRPFSWDSSPSRTATFTFLQQKSSSLRQRQNLNCSVKNVLLVTSSVLLVTSSVLLVTSSVLLVTSSVVLVTSSVLLVTSSVLLVTSSVVLEQSHIYAYILILIHHSTCLDDSSCNGNVCCYMLLACH